MKKIALCLHGYYSNKNGTDLNKISYIKDNIINNINCEKEQLDIFVHSLFNVFFQEYDKILTLYFSMFHILQNFQTQ